MNWLSRIFGFVPKAERQGASLDWTKPHWGLAGPKNYRFRGLFLALDGWLPDGSVLYFDDMSPDSEIKDFLRAHEVPEQLHIARGSVWSRSRVAHVPAGGKVLQELAGIMEHHAGPELAIHMHVYCQGRVLLEWYDASVDPIWLAGELPEEKVQELARRMGVEYKRTGG